MVRSVLLRGVMTGAMATLALLALPAQAQWKWRDPAGHVQYSDLPPPSGTPDKDILSRPAAQGRIATAALPASAASGAASNPLAPRRTDPELEAKLKKAEADKAAKAKADAEHDAAARAGNCARAKSQLQTLDSGIRLARTNDKGEREILDDTQRAAEMKRSRDVMASDCK